MLFDTDVLVWVLRGNGNAADAMNRDPQRQCSVVTYMELLQGARDKQEVREIKAFLAERGFEMLPLTENIGHRASIYLEEYRLKQGIEMGDALQAATAVENGVTLFTANRKHYRPIAELNVKFFSP